MPARTSSCVLKLEEQSGPSFLVLEAIDGYLALEICDQQRGSGAGYVHTLTRRRWREWELAYEAEMRAIEDREGNRTVAQQAAIQAATDAANAALRAAADAAETAQLNADLVRLANALDGALSASRVTASIKRAKAAVIAAQAILDELEEDEDMQAILLTLH